MHYLILRTPDGKYARATSAEQVDAACAVGATVLKIFTQVPNTQAFVALMVRAYGKPAEPPQKLEISGGLDLASRLRERFARRQKNLRLAIIACPAESVGRDSKKSTAMLNSLIKAIGLADFRVTTSDEFLTKPKRRCWLSYC